MTPRLAIATRSRSELLYERASSFWPPADRVPRHRITGLHDWRDAVRYLHELLTLDADLVLNIDEDCFVYDWAEVERLVADAWANSWQLVGMPDTLEHCHHRNNCAFVHNPFFNLLRPQQLQALLLHDPGYANRVLLNHNPPECRFHEPFNQFFITLAQQAARFMSLHGQDHPDGISTTLCHTRPFALHTWYSRQYECDEQHRDRIDARYLEAVDLRNAFVP